MKLIKTKLLISSKILFLKDESSFELVRVKGGLTYYKKSKSPNAKTVFQRTKKFGGGKLMIWGYITFSGKFKIFKCPPSMNSTSYISLLDNEILYDFYETCVDVQNMIFVQDNASCHVSKMTKEWFKSNNIKLLEWPAQSPDINPIENVWNYVNDRVRKLGVEFNNLDELWTALIFEAGKVPPQYIRKLFISIPRRINALKKAKFLATKY